MNVKGQLSFKRIAVTKANKQIIAVTSISAFVVMFCLVGINDMLGIHSYQSKILSADQTADSQLRTDVRAEQGLVSAYKTFVDQNPNVLGKQDTSGQYIYNNASIVLDALPSTYDFPALTTSIQKLLQQGNFNVTSIGGTDESGVVSNAPSPNPSPVAIPFSFTVNNASYQSVQSLFQEIQNSIRPLQIDNVTINGSDTNMSINVNAHTYFQPSKVFKIKSETIQP